MKTSCVPESRGLTPRGEKLRVFRFFLYGTPPRDRCPLFFSGEKRAGGPLRGDAGRDSTRRFRYDLDVPFWAQAPKILRKAVPRVRLGVPPGRISHRFASVRASPVRPGTAGTTPPESEAERRASREAFVNRATAYPPRPPRPSTPVLPGPSFAPSVTGEPG